MAMKAAILVESLTGNTWSAGEMVATGLASEGWTITGVDPVRQPNHLAIQDADLVLVGTWVHGLFVVGQSPWGLGGIRHLPSMRGKQAAVFCTYALNPGKTLDRLTGAVGSLGADVIGGVALHRGKLEQHCEEFAGRLIENVTPL
jgi:hypothetical protein